MPIGYTSEIKNGISFKTFALNCARAFGALIHMKGDPHSAPIREDKVSKYHFKELEKSKKELNRILSLTVEECEIEAKKEYQEIIDRYNRWEKEELESRKKYEKMLVEVEKWEPPTKDHIKMKNFMIKQIKDSISFDCEGFNRTDPPELTGREWRAKEVDQLEKDVKYHMEEYHKDKERVDCRNKWVKDLMESLDMPLVKTGQGDYTKEYHG